MITFKTAYKMAGITFGIGTLLFLIQLALGDAFVFAFFGIIFIGIATLVNGIAFLVAFIRLIREDLLDSFFAMCILLVNLPIALGYFYILMEFT